MEAKNKMLILAIAAIVILTIFAVVLIKNETTGRATMTKGTIKLGLTTALSGNYAYIGEDVLKGVKEAIDEASDRGAFNQKIELIVEDNQADSKTAVVDYQLFKGNGARVVFSSFSTITEALSPLANQDRTILLYNAVSADFAKNYEYVFKVYSNADDEAEIISEGIKKSNGKIAFIYVNNPTSTIMKKIFSEKLGNMEEYKFEIKDSDFKTIILRLKESGVENIIVNGYPNQILNFVKQSNEFNYNPKKIFVVSDGGSKDVVDNIESYLMDSDIKYILVGYGPQSKEIYYVFSYDLAKVLITGMESCQRLGKEPDDSECLKTELQKVKINGKSGFIDMDNSRVAKLSPQLYTVKNKELVLYK